MEPALHALKLIVGVLVIWYAFPVLGDPDPMWATVSLVVVASAPASTLTASLQRMLNTSIGCVVGLAALLVFGAQVWVMCLAIGAVTLLCSAVLGPAQRWTIAPVTTVIVMAQAVLARSPAVGMHTAAKRFGEVLAGSLVAVVLSALFLRFAPHRAGAVTPPGRRPHPDDAAHGE
jgi:uncharacterized membrane protein YccC